jgi:hypothetical protein
MVAPESGAEAAAEGGVLPQDVTRQRNAHVHVLIESRRAVFRISRILPKLDLLMATPSKSRFDRTLCYGNDFRNRLFDFIDLFSRHCSLLC